ncbi:unnamed protein product, partial [Hapterophycus canaliculatus]
FPSRTRVGIVAPTGAGKSSLITALFRMVEPMPGSSVVVDGQDVLRMGLQDLRRRLAIIPQDPTLFEGTIRSNVDPFDDYSDSDIWDALRQCRLHSFVAAQDLRLQHESECLFSAEGSNLSVGQRQLMCMARALLRRAAVLVMDEATANVDPETDSLIQEAMKEGFGDCTILCIAHRHACLCRAFPQSIARVFEDASCFMRRLSLTTTLPTATYDTVHVMVPRPQRDATRRGGMVPNRPKALLPSGMKAFHWVLAISQPPRMRTFTCRLSFGGTGLMVRVFGAAKSQKIVWNTHFVNSMNFWSGAEPRPLLSMATSAFSCLASFVFVNAFLSPRIFFYDRLALSLCRLHTVAFYDRVLVLDQGKVAEYDTPLALLRNPYSQFRAMCEKTGDLEGLKRVARESAKNSANKSSPGASATGAAAAGIAAAGEDPIYI